MPDFDDLSSFSDSFSQGTPVNPLPASEVRRKGDRMRRRSTAMAAVGGVVAAAVFIGTPVALLNGGDDGRDTIQPAPSTTQSQDAASTPEVTPDAEGVTEIPADFPIAVGLQGGGDSQVEGPGADVETSPVMDVCGSDVWAPSGVVERLAAKETGIEYVESRELNTFITPDEASESLTQVREAVNSCPTMTGEFYDWTTQVLEGPKGYDSFTWGRFAEESLDGAVFQLTRVGSSVLVVFAAGEMSEASLQPTADEMTKTTLELAPQMCLWTKDKC